MYSDNRSPCLPLIKPVLAVGCLALGVVGLVLPLIPGIPLLIVGALLLRRRGGRGPATNATTRHGLSAAEWWQLQFWLLARRITTAAESMRLARHARTRRRARQDR
jgi:hypothetical protein